MSEAVGIGVDVGSSGVRVIAATATGEVLATAREGWPLRRDPSGPHEQDPLHWWDCILRCLSEVCTQMTAAQRDSVAGLSATATSGTVVVTDASLAPLRPAMMWDDKRAVAEAEECATAGAELSAELGYRYRPTFSLPKFLWIARHEPSIWERVVHAAHATDWLNAKLCNEPPVCDYTNSLKSGYDLLRFGWPAYIDGLGIDSARLPPVVAAGTPVGTVDPALAASLGLPERARVVAGMTDANTAQVASGAFDVGQWVTTIGTGLSLKGVSEDLLLDPRGVLYCHRHPDGYWIPSGTSHSGADAISARFASEDLDRLTAAASERGPASVVMFPLPRTGEFFPFWAPQATGFVLGAPADEVDEFRACLEGIAYVERLSHEVVTDLGGVVEGAITTVGGGSRSALWRQIRADVLGRTVRAAANAETAFGAALVALSASPNEVVAAARRAVAYTGETDPDEKNRAHYDDQYGRFVDALRARGYL